MRINAIRTDEGRLFQIWMDGDDIVIEDLETDSIRIRIDCVELQDAIREEVGG